MSADGRISGDWLADARLARLMDAIARDGDVARVVGGAVRNTLMGLPVADIDVATTARPETVVARALAEGLRPVPTGIAHGTVTVVVAGLPIEVTTLREDVSTDGRNATVAFGRDWRTDAERRDFTVNALYCDVDGTVLDLVGGVADCAARRIRFIGRAEDRIREDYLRILRFFRFHAAYGGGAPDGGGLAACIALQAGMARLSAERIGQEMKKLAVAARAPETLAVMAETGILARALGQPGDIDAAAGLFREARVGLWTIRPEDGVLVLAALAGDAAALGNRLRLSRAESERMVRAREAREPAADARDAAAVRRLAYRFGGQGVRDGLLLAAATAGDDELAGRLATVDAFDPGLPPVRGRDLTGFGVTGPRVGDLVRMAETLWVDSDFTATRADILNRFQRDGLLARG